MHKDSYVLRYLPLFYEELEHDVIYIASNLSNQSSAIKLLDDVEAAIFKRLKDGPEMFEKVPSRKDRKHPYYRIYVRNYIIYYVVFEENGKKIMEVRRFRNSREDRSRDL